MSKMSKAIVALGVVAGLGVAAMPLSSYAANSDTKQAQVQVEVGGSISLALSGTAPTAEGEPGWIAASNTLDLGKAIINGDVVSGVIDATVTSNDPIGYTLTMYATDEGIMKGSTGASIPNAKPEQGKAGWGYKTTGDEYTAMPLQATPASIATATAGTGALNAKTSVTFGVSVDDTIPEGTYTGTVVFTATAQ